MLKKIIVGTLIATVVAVSSASAALNVLWNGLDGFYRSDETTPLLDPQGSGATALYQLIQTTVNGYDVAGPGASVGASEIVLDEYVNVESGTGSNLYGEFPSLSYSGAFTLNTYLYVRIFDQGTGAGGSGVVDGTWYYNGPLYVAVDQVNVDDSQEVSAQGNNTIGGFGDALNLQVVPEPSVLAFFGIGGLALAIRRRIKA